MSFVNISKDWYIVLFIMERPKLYQMRDRSLSELSKAVINFFYIFSRQEVNEQQRSLQSKEVEINRLKSQVITVF